MAGFREAETPKCFTSQGWDLFDDQFSTFWFDVWEVTFEPGGVVFDGLVPGACGDAMGQRQVAPRVAEVQSGGFATDVDVAGMMAYVDDEVVHGNHSTANPVTCVVLRGKCVKMSLWGDG